MGGGDSQEWLDHFNASDRTATDFSASGMEDADKWAVGETPWPTAMMAAKIGLEEMARDSSGRDGGCVPEEMVEK